ncbi:putative nucleotide-binding protein containing TIR-like domain protein [uncultured archaeon]|nr:putative nucleotide-binding protein containing TIR-like domain protein [uncultured archaeon]
MDISQAIVSFKQEVRNFSEDILGVGKYATPIYRSAEKIIHFIDNPSQKLEEIFTKLKEECLNYDTAQDFFGGKEEKGLYHYAELLLIEVDKIRFNKDQTFSKKENKYHLREDKKIFIIHGRRTDLADELHRILNEHKLNSVILQYIPNTGRTIIEKLEEDGFNSSDYAIAIMTPDDSGGLINSKKDSPRARQNVILEIGAFVMKDRKRLCILKNGEVELPSDLSGVLYLEFDKKIEEISRAILRELSKSGFNISF